MTTPFKASRPDGRSDRQVIYDLTHTAEPGTTFTYGQLQTALQEGLEQEVKRSRIYQAIAAANETLLREQSRYLSVVPNQGYRMIRAEEHLPVSRKRKDRGQTQLKQAEKLLRHTQMDELTEAQRKLHEGQLIMLSSLCAAVDDSNRRHERSEQLIQNLLNKSSEIESRMDRLESQAGLARGGADMGIAA